MAELTCSHCFSTNVQVEDAFNARDVVTLRCLACGRTSQMDVENPLVDPDNASTAQGHGRAPRR